MFGEVDWQNYLPDLYELRAELHAHPKVSEQEAETRERLMTFIRERTDLVIHDEGRWFYVDIPGRVNDEKIAIRADHDAIVNTNGEAFHGCGHDGHSTILAGLAWLLSDYPVDPHVILVFQHAEENGVGAKEIVPTLKSLEIDRMYGLHNFPGAPLGEVITRVGTFFCASTGLRIQLLGRQSHAAEPEKGLNPAFAMAKILTEIEELSSLSETKNRLWRGHEYEDMILATVVHVEVGENDKFGISPARGELDLTLRAAKMTDLSDLCEEIEHLAEKLADKYELHLDISYTDTFPDTVNPEEEVQRVKNILKDQGKELLFLEEPFRPSEDFGWYLKEFPGCYVGLGSGEDHLPLHHDQFEFPDNIIRPGIEFFYGILSE